MAYSVDLRKRVVEYVKEGGEKKEAAKIFKVSLWCVYDWLKRENLEPIKVKRRKRKLDWEALKQDVKDRPNALLKERAKKFGVKINAIWYALKEMRISYKKNIPIRGAKI